MRVSAKDGEEKFEILRYIVAFVLFIGFVDSKTNTATMPTLSRYELDNGFGQLSHS